MKCIRTMFSKTVVLFGALILFIGCKDDRDPCGIISPGSNARNELQECLITAGDGDVIKLDEGVFEFDRTVTMESKSEVTLEGRGRENTILSFANQISGGNGLLITNSDNIVVRNFTIRDTKGDALKFQDSHSIVMYRVGAEWSGEPSAENGGYGLYPVTSSNILIEECYAFGASDAGIYVGQSDKTIVRNSTAEGNVAGIEIENTTNADVHDNTLIDNSAGILVFDLPGLSQSGARTRVFSNQLTDNIRGNFAPGGSLVAEVPAGTGILVLSTGEVEVFDNTLVENNVAGTAVASYAALVELGVAPPVSDPDYNPFPANVYIHNNSYSRSNTYPEPEEQSAFGNLLMQVFGSNPIPDVILDGIFAPGTEASGSICIENNSGDSFVNLKIPNDFPNNMSFDPSPHDCSLDPLPPVEIDIPDFL